MSSQLDSLTEFIAKQLNDHSTSPRGVVQPTYYQWTEHHIHDALLQGASYIYSIKSDLFSVLNCYVTEETTCTVDLNSICCRVIDVVSVGVMGCANVDNDTLNGRSLLSLVEQLPCDRVCPDTPSFGVFSFQTLARGIFQFRETIPKNTKLTFICSNPPSSIDSLPSCLYAEYRPLLTSFALWWLLLTTNESRANLERVNMYYQQMQDFVTLKLKLEFSLVAENFKDGSFLQDETP